MVNELNDAGVSELEKTKKLLDVISPTFCAAKWFQVTLHLQNGHTHSCHHPPSHQVGLSEIAQSPDALHNSAQKTRERSEMLEGKRPRECQFCWSVEDLPGANKSDRIIKSNDFWAKDQIASRDVKSWIGPVNPTYVEVSFSNQCNFKCAYCSPHVSSKWMSEIVEFGSQWNHLKYHDLEELKAKGMLPIEEEVNPYVDAFWKWWPDLKTNLKVLRITGGEPLLSPSTSKVLQSLEKEPQPKLSFAINSNLGVPGEIVDRYISDIQKVIRVKGVSDFAFYTSMDTWGEQAEYIRYGLDQKLFLRNVTKILSELSQVKIGIMCTFNALSIPNFRRLLDLVLELKEVAAQNNNFVFLDVSHLVHPEFLSVQICDSAMKETLARDLGFMEENKIEVKGGHKAFFKFEIDKVIRLVEYINQPIESRKQTDLRKAFHHFISEYDRRRKAEFSVTFPELAGFYSLCEDLSVNNR